MQILIKMLSDRTFPIDVELSDTIRIVCSKIEEEIQFPSDQQWLIFDCKHIDDYEKTVGDYNIQKDSVIWVLYYPR